MGCFGFGYLIDLVIIATGNFKDKNGQPIKHQPSTDNRKNTFTKAKENATTVYEKTSNIGLQANDPQLVVAVSERIADILSELSEMAYGFAFANVIDAYWKGMKNGDDALKMSALRWLRGEFANKTEAKRELPVDSIIDDQNWYEFLKLFALFVKKAGYKGLLVFIDEGVNLYKINHKQARDSNYEKVLTVFNDTMQGKAEYIGVFMSGTPQFF